MRAQHQNSFCIIISANTIKSSSVSSSQRKTVALKRTKTSQSIRRRRIGIIRMGAPLPTTTIGHRLGTDDDDASEASRTKKVKVQFWLDYACPFSAKMFRTMRKDLMTYYDDRSQVQFEMFHQVQPWHTSSSIMHETALAYGEVIGEGGFLEFSEKLFEKREQFADSLTFDRTRHEITDDIIKACDDRLREDELAKVRKYARLNTDTSDKNGGTLVTQKLKYHIKLGRQLGIHVSPTVLVNGLICETSSSWTLKEWRELLDPLLTQ
jgi:protein-disulfide isomerase